MSAMRRRPVAAIALAATLLVLSESGPALAVRSPFGVATPDSTGPAFTGLFGGFFVWIATWQSEFYKALTDTLMQVRHSGHALLLMIGLSFLYGIFHAVGPGHGKAVITSYLLVSRQTVRRGIAISFAAAVMQGLVAIAVVLVATVALRSTALEMTHATDWFEIISYGLVTAVGLWLLWAKTIGRHLDHRHEPAKEPSVRHEALEACTHHHGHHHHHHVHGAGDTCGHSHAPDPRLLAKPLTASRAWAATMAVGIRPCSGAIIVLVFALSQRLLIAGVGSVIAMSFGTFITVSTLAVLAVMAKDTALKIADFDSGAAERVMRVVEIGGALLVLVLGLTLLGGALQGGLPA
jgi:ABC-type nickel/cobalt efflux system permease component RcnA